MGRKAHCAQLSCLPIKISNVRWFIQSLSEPEAAIHIATAVIFQMLARLSLRLSYLVVTPVNFVYKAPFSSRQWAHPRDKFPARVVADEPSVGRVSQTTDGDNRSHV